MRAYLTKHRILALILAVWTGTGSLSAQFFSDTNHPELEWFDIETEHFKITYHTGLEPFAQRVAGIAEEVYGPITDLYDFRPKGKPRILCRDIDDTNRSAFYPTTSTIDFWATGLTHDFDLRGAKTDWVRNVLTHEFTHLVNTQTAQKMSGRMQGVDLQTFLYQAENRREDVTTGFPNAIASIVYPSEIIPPWFSEGSAQYMAAGAQHDTWDSHRDMILRQAVLNGTMLTYDEMNVFGAKTGLGFENVYDHGYSLVLHIVNQYGEGALRDILRAMTPAWRYDFSGAIESTIGISGQNLYNDWKAALEERYQLQQAALKDRLAEGDLIFDNGYMNLHPRWSPEGDRIAFLTNEQSDYGRTSLIVYTPGDSTKKAVGPARTAFDWDDSGDRLIYTNRSRPNEHGSRYFDLYRINLSDSSGSTAWQTIKGTIGLSTSPLSRFEQLTTEGRALHPHYSPDQARAVFVHNAGGTNNLAILDIGTGKIRPLTDFDDGTQVHTPDWSPDGTRIAFSIFTPDGDRSIATISPDGGDWSYLVTSSATDRDPRWTPDSTGLVFSSDQNGIFDLFHLDIESGDIHRITRVTGGAIQPDVRARDEKIVFSNYGSSGYEIRTIEKGGLWEVVQEGTFRTARSLAASESGSRPFETKAYETAFMGFSMSPRIVLDVGKLKAGFYLFSSEALGKQNMWIQALLAHDKDMELFGTYEYKGWTPTAYLSAFRVTHHVEEDIVDRDRDGRVFNRTFSLNGASLGLKHRIRSGSLINIHADYNRFGNSVDQARFNGQNRGVIGATFLNGFNLAFSYHHNSTPPLIRSTISPTAGRDIYFRYNRHFDFFLKGFEPNTTIVIEQFQNFFYDELTLDWNEYLAGPGETAIGLRVFGGWMGDIVNDPEADGYFDFRMGGLPLMKGYTFFSLEGSRAAMFRAAWSVPLRRNINKQTGPLYSNQLYTTFYGGLGRAWDGTPDDDLLLRGWKKDAGIQFRYDANLFYDYPARFSFDVAYGFDNVPLTEPGQSLERSGAKVYFTLLFGFFPTVGATP
jgi:Tol biopolymer transport system component